MEWGGGVHVSVWRVSGLVLAYTISYRKQKVDGVCVAENTCYLDIDFFLFHVINPFLYFHVNFSLVIFNQGWNSFSVVINPRNIQALELYLEMNNLAVVKHKYSVSSLLGKLSVNIMANV